MQPNSWQRHGGRCRAHARLRARVASRPHPTPGRCVPAGRSHTRVHIVAPPADCAGYVPRRRTRARGHPGLLSAAVHRPPGRMAAARRGGRRAGEAHPDADRTKGDGQDIARARRVALPLRALHLLRRRALCAGEPPLWHARCVVPHARVHALHGSLAWRPRRGVVLSVPALARARCAPHGPRHPPAPRGGPRVIMSARAPAVVRPSHSQAEGAANAVELSALILAALAEARAGADEDSGAHTPPGLEREETDSFVGGGGAGGPLPSTLRRLGRCLLLIDHIELPQGGAGTAGMMALLQNLLQVRTSLGSALPPGAPRTRTALLAAGRAEVLSVTARAPLQLFGSRSARC